MGGLFPQSELEDRQKKAQQKLLQLKEAYNNFIYFWNQMEQEEKALLKDVHEHIDEEKLKSVLKNIEQHN